MGARGGRLEGVPHYYERCRKEVEVTALAADAAAPAGAAARVAPWVYMLPGERVTDAHLEREMLPSYEPAKHFTHYVPRAHRPRSHAAFSGGAAPREAQRPPRGAGAGAGGARAARPPSWRAAAQGRRRAAHVSAPPRRRPRALGMQRSSAGERSALSQYATFRLRQLATPWRRTTSGDVQGVGVWGPRGGAASECT